MRAAAVPAVGLVIVVAAVFLVAETVLVILLKQVDPRDPVGVVIAGLMGVALVANFVVGVAAARAVQAARRREATLTAELARVMLRAADSRSALDGMGERLAQALNLSSVALEPNEVAGDEHRAAIPLRDGARVLGTLLIPADVPTATQQRMRRMVPSLEALLSAGRDREHINKALIASRDALGRFFDLSSDLLCITGRDRVLMVNPAFEQTLGYTIENLASRQYLDIVDLEDRDHVRAVLDTPSRDEPARYENRVICSDGSLRWIEWSITSHRDVFYAAGRDVTDRRREQDQLRQAQAMLEASRDRLNMLAEQQAALRRVATLVAQGVSPSAVFDAVAEEMGRCLHVAGAAVSRYEEDTVAIVAIAPVPPEFKDMVPFGARFPLEGDNVSTRVFRTGRAARMDSQQDATGAISEQLRALGVRSIVAVPIVAGGRLWGMATGGSVEPEPLPPDTEARMSDFADLVATAIANAATRAELIASRARIVAAADDTRRRLERDLHDGAQQRLIAVGLKLRVAEAAVAPNQVDLKNELAEAISDLIEVSSELQEISRGIHPAILSQGGLAPALGTLARRSTVPVDLDVAINQPLSDPVEVAAYYAVAEALTNAAKHAHASRVTVSAKTHDDKLNLSIEDNGIGGADATKGSGLIGLKDRVEVLGGQMHINVTPHAGHR